MIKYFLHLVGRIIENVFKVAYKKDTISIYTLEKLIGNNYNQEKPKGLLTVSMENSTIFSIGVVEAVDNSASKDILFMRNFDGLWVRPEKRTGFTLCASVYNYAPVIVFLSKRHIS